MQRSSSVCQIWTHYKSLLFKATDKNSIFARIEMWHKHKYKHSRVSSFTFLSRNELRNGDCRLGDEDCLLIRFYSHLKSSLNFAWWALWRAVQKLGYAAKCGLRTVFFSKRRKNSSLCADHAAPEGTLFQPGIYTARMGFFWQWLWDKTTSSWHTGGVTRQTSPIASLSLCVSHIHSVVPWWLLSFGWVSGISGAWLKWFSEFFRCSRLGT